MQPDFTEVIALAALAPSVHNTQPWLFQAEGDTLRLRTDPRRRLSVLDPDGRQQVISCGAALHLARLGLRLQGFDSRVERPASSGLDGDAARLHVVAGPPASDEEHRLARAAHERHTQRGRFDRRAVSTDVLHRMRDAAQAEGAWVGVLTEPAHLVALAVLLSRADEIEHDDAAYRDELVAWTTRPDSSGDGVPAGAVVDVTARASSLRLRDFALAARPSGAAPAPHDPPPAEHPVAIVLGTVDDDVAAWLVAGQALMALLLRATVEGVQASPLGQVVDQPWTRSRLAAELGVVGYPQMVLRAGHAEPGPETPRRPVSDVLR